MVRADHVVVDQVHVHVHSILSLLSRLGLALVRSVLAQAELHHASARDDFCDDCTKMEESLSPPSASTSVDTLVALVSLKTGAQGLSLVRLHVCQII